MSEKLKPCPFCGSEAAMECRDGDESFYVFCAKCGVAAASRYAKDAARKAWNRRERKVDQDPSLPLLARISYLFGEIVNLNEEIANLRNEVARLTSENIGYREKQSFTKKFGAKSD